MDMKKIAIGASVGGISFFLIILIPIIVVFMIVALLSNTSSDSNNSEDDEDEDTLSVLSSSDIISQDGLYFVSNEYGSLTFCYPLATDGGKIYLTASFGQTGTYWSTYHTGQDFASVNGASVVAVAAGTVITAVENSKYYGNFVVIEHVLEADDEVLTFYTQYSHMKDNSMTVSVGDLVVQGSVLGKEGATGNVTGRHCHFELSTTKPTSVTGSIYTLGIDPMENLYLGNIFDGYPSLYEKYWATSAEESEDNTIDSLYNITS